MARKRAGRNRPIRTAETDNEKTVLEEHTICKVYIVPELVIVWQVGVKEKKGKKRKEKKGEEKETKIDAGIQSIPHNQTECPSDGVYLSRLHARIAICHSFIDAIRGITTIGVCHTVVGIFLRWDTARVMIRPVEYLARVA